MKAVFTRIENIDTDQIIPARFLKQTSREGFGKAMFHDWRYNGDGTLKQDSIFTPYEGVPEEKKPRILVAGKNFGCGSSREHAAWAIADYGFTAVVSSFFADIFRNNALNNMLLPVQVSGEFLEKLFTALQEDPETSIEIDLAARRITIASTGEWECFPIGEYKQNCLLNGQKDIDYLVSTKGLVESFEKERK